VFAALPSLRPPGIRSELGQLERRDRKSFTFTLGKREIDGFCSERARVHSSSLPLALMRIICVVRVLPLVVSNPAIQIALAKLLEYVVYLVAKCVY
jgi:hypothetical protein